MGTFDFANEALRRDITAYAAALRTIVETMPQAVQTCDQILKEVRLARALLAFASTPHAAELAQTLYTLSNLWPYRERPYARTLGFDDEIREARQLRDEAQKGSKVVARFGGDSLSAEIVVCFANIAKLLEDEQTLLETCNASIKPHAENMDMTRKRLTLLTAAVDARMPPSAEQRAAFEAYAEAGTILRDWENGVPLDERGVGILEHCILLLDGATNVFLTPLNPAPGARA